MAVYKHAEYIRQTNSAAFDRVHAPATLADRPGIYHCVFCGHEITVAKNSVLPPATHHTHKSRAPVEWRLVVSSKETDE